MGLRDRLSRKQQDPDGQEPPLPDGAPPAGGDEMPTIIQGAPVPGESGPEDQTFIATAAGFQEPQPGGDPAVPGETAAPGEPAAHTPAGEPAPEQGPGPAAEQALPRPGFRERGRLRRRLRYLREVRELGYRDLGGLVLDQHRFQRPNEELVEGKVQAIEALDREMRAIEQALDQSTPYTELFIPGLSACARCGALHGSDANFCPNCGLSFKGPRTVAGVGAPEGAPLPPGAPPAHGAPAPQVYPPAPQAYPPAPVPQPYPAAPVAPVPAPQAVPPEVTEVQSPPPAPE